MERKCVFLRSELAIEWITCWPSNAREFGGETGKICCMPASEFGTFKESWHKQFFRQKLDFHNVGFETMALEAAQFLFERCGKRLRLHICDLQHKQKALGWKQLNPFMVTHFVHPRHIESVIGSLYRLRCQWLFLERSRRALWRQKPSWTMLSACSLVKLL